MKGRKTSMSLLTRNLFYLYEGPGDAQKTSMSLLTRNLFYLYERPRDLQKPPEKREFVLLI